MIAGTLESTPDVARAILLGGMTVVFPGTGTTFCNNLTGVTMGVATYKGMYAAKMYSPAADSPPQCSARLLPGQGD